MAYIEIDSELLLLAASASERDRREIADRLADMPPAELRVLRDALSVLDEALDAAALDKHLKRD